MTQYRTASPLQFIHAWIWLPLCVFPVCLWLQGNLRAWVIAPSTCVPAISWGVPACFPNTRRLANEPRQLLWEVTQTWWSWASSQKTLNTSEGPDDLIVISSTFRRWRNSLVNERQWTCFWIGWPACRNPEQARQGQPFPSLLELYWEMSPAGLYSPLKATAASGEWSHCRSESCACSLYAFLWHLWNRCKLNFKQKISPRLLQWWMTYSLKTDTAVHICRCIPCTDRLWVLVEFPAEK